MEVRFGLVINFDCRDVAAQAVHAVPNDGAVRVRGLDLAMSRPTVTEVRGARGTLYTQVFIEAAGICRTPTGLILPPGVQTIVDDDLFQLGEQLYGLLRRLDGYVAALVGWSPGILVDTDDPTLPWLTNGGLYRMDGLVISSNVADRWHVDSRFVPFAGAYRWLPYQGRTSA